MAAPVDASCEEAPAYFPAGSETLFGISCRAGGSANRTGVLISSGGLTGTSTVGRNQMFVRLARRLAGLGFPNLRFDYHGIGQSTGVLEEFRLDATEPFVDDIRGAADWLLGQGVDRMILLGKCFGSRMALTAAAALPSISGLVLVGAPVRDFGTGEKAITRLATELTTLDFARRGLRLKTLRKLADPRHRRAYARAVAAKLRVLRTRPDEAGPEPEDASWVSPHFLRPLSTVLERGVPVQLVYGVDDEFYSDFLVAREQGRLNRLLARFPQQVDVTTTPGQVRGFAQLDVQDAIIDVACDWIRSCDDHVAWG